MRLILVILSALTLATFIASAFVRREKIPRRTRRHMLWIQGILMYIAYGNAVAYTNGYPFNEASWFGIFILVGFNISIWWKPKGDNKLPPDDGSFGQMLLDIATGGKNGRSSGGSEG